MLAAVSSFRNEVASRDQRRSSPATHRQPLRPFRHKGVYGFLLTICFWFAVPYSFPIHLDADPIKAASSEADAFQGSLSREIALPCAALLCAFGLYRLPRRRGVRNSPLFLCLVSYLGWAFASLLWSVDPAITRKRLVVFLADAFVAYTIARLASLRDVAVLGFCATGAVALIALWAEVLVLKDFRPADPDFRFMGVMTANYQAMNLFVCLLCGLTLLQAHPRWVRWLGPLLALYSALLFLTRARVGTLLFAAVFLVIAVQMARRHLGPHGRALLVLLLATIAIPGAVLAVGRSGSGALTSVFMMGRHDTENTASLSNRAPLWSELLDSVRERPWTGVGFDAFWSPERVERVSLDQGWVVPHAHNTYLDETLFLGIPGGVLFFGVLAGAGAVAWKRYRRRPDPFHLLPVLLLGWLMLLSTTESLPPAPYLPTLLAYSCVVRMCMWDGSESREPAENDLLNVIAGRMPAPWTRRRVRQIGVRV